MRQRTEGLVVFGSLLLAVGAGCASAPPPQQAPRVMVDLHRAAEECRDGRAARADLMESFRRSQKALDERQVELHATLVRIRIDRDRGEDVREREAAFRQQVEMVQAEYQQLQAELMVQEERRAAPIYARLRQALPQLAAAHHVDKIAEVPPAPRGNGPVTDLIAELIRVVDAQPPPPGEAAAK